MQAIHHLAELFAILTLVLIACGSLLVRFAFKANVTRKDLTYQPTVSVLMSCFNEGRSVYDTIKSVCDSDYPKHKLFVIAVDDTSTDDSWKWMQQAARDFPNVTVVKNEKNLGKPKSLLKALREAKTELIINIDSDCRLDPQAVKEIAACFFDPAVGGVGGAVLVRNQSQNILTQMQAIQYNSSFQLSKVGETFSGAVNCISGCLFGVRRQLYLELMPEIESRNWLGLDVKDGEDRHMTNLILVRGLKTVMNSDAKVYTDVPAKFKQFFSQQLRWRRGVIRMFLSTLTPSEFITRVKTIPPLSNFKFYALLAVAFSWPFFVTWILLIDGPFLALLIKLQIFVIMSFVFFMISRFFALKQGLKMPSNPLSYLFTPMWMLIDMTLMTILAVCTLASVSWETRNKPVTQ